MSVIHANVVGNHIVSTTVHSSKSVTVSRTISGNKACLTCKAVASTCTHVARPEPITSSSSAVRRNLRNFRFFLARSCVSSHKPPLAYPGSELFESPFRQQVVISCRFNMQVQTVQSAIGNTPLVRLQRLVRKNGAAGVMIAIMTLVSALSFRQMQFPISHREM